MAYTPSCMHACMHMALLQALSILLLASMLVPAGSAEEAPSGYGVDLIHVDANGGFTREELIRSAVDRAHLTAASLSAEELIPSHELEMARVGEGHYMYLMKLKIGTPPEPIGAVADTGSGLVWTKQLKLCIRSASKTFKYVPAGSDSCDGPCNCKDCTGCPDGRLCTFMKTYGDGKWWAKGFMGNEMLDFDNGDDKFIAFGCAIDDNTSFLPETAQGVVGLDRGPMSLVKQLKFTKFSYCLSNQNDPTLKSPLWFGDHVPALSDEWSSTRLVSWANKYAVEMDGIAIGTKYRQLQKDDFKHRSKDNKGVIIVDSGSSRTRLETNVFKVLKDLLANELESTEPSKEKSTCLPAPTSKRPDMVLHFSDGGKMHLPWANYMVEEPNSESSCLAIHESEGISVLGNFQQQNILMLYDLTEEREKLSFVRREPCM